MKTLFALFIVSVSVNAQVLEYSCETLLNVGGPKLKLVGTKDVSIDTENREFAIYLNVQQTIIGDTVPFALVALPARRAPEGKTPVAFSMAFHQNTVSALNDLVMVNQISAGVPIRTYLKARGRHYYVNCEPK